MQTKVRRQNTVFKSGEWEENISGLTNGSLKNLQ